MNRDESYLLDIYKLAQETQEFIKDMNAEGFVLDRKTQAATLHNIMVLRRCITPNNRILV